MSVKPGLSPDFELSEELLCIETLAQFLTSLIGKKGLINLHEGKGLFKHAFMKDNRLFFAPPHGVYSLVHKSFDLAFNEVEEDLRLLLLLALFVLAQSCCRQSRKLRAPPAVCTLDVLLIRL